MVQAELFQVSNFEHILNDKVRKKKQYFNPSMQNT